MQQLISRFYGKFLLLGLFSPVLFLIQVWYFNSKSLGVVLLAIYFIVISYFYQKVLAKFFYFKAGNIFTYILGLFLGLWLWGALSSIFIIFFKLNLAAILFVSILNFLMAYLLTLFIQPQKVRISSNQSNFFLRKHPLFSKHYILLVFYGLFWFISAYFLYQSGSKEMISTPWFGLDSRFIYTFFAATTLLVSLMLSKFRSKVTLFCIIAHSLLLHAYLPSAHFLPFGSDVWRILGIEKKILSGQAINPSLLFPVEFNTLFGVKVPKVFTALSQFAYGTLWGLSVNLSKIAGVDLLAVNKWLLPILWGAVTPVIFFQIGLVLFKSVRKSIWLSFFSLVPFSFQALGSLTLPVSLGYLSFFFVFLLWLIYLRDGRRWQRILLVGLIGLMYFGYLLFAFVMTILFVSGEVWKRIDIPEEEALEVITKSALFIILFLIIPVVELTLEFSHITGYFQKSIQVPEVFYLIGRLFTGWDYSQKLVEYNIRAGNIFFNHTPESSFISTIYTDFRLHILVGMLIIWIFFGWGFYYLMKQDRLEQKALLFLAMLTFGGYVIGWFFLEGNRILSARMNGLIAFSITLVMFFGIWQFLGSIATKVNKQAIKLILFIFLILFSCFMATSYLSGPDITAPNKQRYEVAKYISKQGEFSKQNNCVISNIWVLLPLQGLSAGNVAAGGFPTKERLSQPERQSVLAWLKTDPEKKTLEDAHYVTGADYCWIALKKNEIPKQNKEKISRLVNSKPGNIAGYWVWQEKVEQN